MASTIEVKLSPPETPHRRLNIETLQNQYPLQFSLFIRVLDVLKKSSEDPGNPYGWFQQCGIHGLPNVRWNNDKTPIINNTDELFGYCSHASALFPPWHRIYIWQLEVTMIGLAVGIVNKEIENGTIPHCPRPQHCDKFRHCIRACAPLWLKAAKELRFPYWDWANGLGRMPNVLNDPEVVIESPAKGAVRVANPLVYYHFQKNETMPPPDDQYWFKEPYASQWPTTLRCPDDKGVSHPEWANEQLESRHQFNYTTNQTTNLTEYVYTLLSAVDEYLPFSNTAYARKTGGRPGTIDYASLEDVHNNVHLFVGVDSRGKSGHMSLNEYAAFDPIFWLHHCNVDRIFAMWQQLNPDAKFSVPFEGSGTGVSNAGTLENAESNLIPFIEPGTGGDYWTSELIQNWDSIYKLGYYYPETYPFVRAGSEKAREFTASWVEKLYGPDSGVADLKEVLRATLLRELPPPRIQGKAYRREWQVASRIKRFEVKGSFHIHFFLGKVPDNCLEWLKPNQNNTYIGSNSVFIANFGCAKCDKQKQDEQVVTGITPLTRTLLHCPTGFDLDDDSAIEEYLTKELSWRVQKATGEEVPLDQVPSLLVAVTSTPITQAPVTSPFPLPEWHHDQEKIHPRVTTGRPNGLTDVGQY